MVSASSSKVEEVVSPCMGVCVLDDDDMCIGCYRTCGEIASWAAANNAERQTILDRVDERVAKLQCDD